MSNTVYDGMKLKGLEKLDLKIFFPPSNCKNAGWFVLKYCWHKALPPKHDC